METLSRNVQRSFDPMQDLLSINNPDIKELQASIKHALTKEKSLRKNILRYIPPFCSERGHYNSECDAAIWILFNNQRYAPEGYKFNIDAFQFFRDVKHLTRTIEQEEFVDEYIVKWQALLHSIRDKVIMMYNIIK